MSAGGGGEGDGPGASAAREGGGGEGLQPSAAPAEPPLVAVFKMTVTLHEQMTHVLSCDAESCDAAFCALLKRRLAHARGCVGSNCQGGDPGHHNYFLQLVFAHATNCIKEPGASCSVPRCDAARTCLAAFREALKPLSFDFACLSNERNCRHSSVSFQDLPFVSSSPHGEVLPYRHSVRLAGRPPAEGVPLLEFLTGLTPLPGLADALRGTPRAVQLLASYGWCIRKGLVPSYTLLPLNLGMLVDCGCVDDAAARLAGWFDDPPEPAEAGDVGELMHWSLAAMHCARAVASAQARAIKSGDAARAADFSASVQRSGLLDLFGDVCLSLVKELEDAAAEAVEAVLEAAERAGGAQPEFEAARTALLSNWVLPGLTAVVDPNAPPIAPPASVQPDSLGAALWRHGLEHAAQLGVHPSLVESRRFQDRDYGRCHVAVTLLRAFTVLAATPAARDLGLRHRAFRAVFDQACKGNGCTRVRCSDKVVTGAALRQLCRAPEATAGTPEADELLGLIREAMKVPYDRLRRWYIVYAIMPMARAERRARAAGAEAAQRAACRERCCVAACAAPLALAALTRAGIVPLLGEAVRSSPAARKSACTALLLLFGRDAPSFVAQFAGHVAPLLDSLRAGAAIAVTTAAAVARQSAAETQRRRALRAARIEARHIDADGDVTPASPCASGYEATGCDSDCANASDDDDEEGESAPLAGYLWDSLVRAALGMPPPVLPEHGADLPGPAPLPPQALAAAAAEAPPGGGVGRKSSAAQRRKNGKGGAAAAPRAPDAAAVAAAEAAAAALLAEEEAAAEKASRAAEKASRAAAKKSKKKSKAAAQAASAEPEAAPAADDAGEQEEAVPSAAVVAGIAQQAPPAAAAAPPPQHAPPGAVCRDGCCAPAAPFRLGPRRQRAPAAAPVSVGATQQRASEAPPATAQAKGGDDAEALMAELFPHLHIAGGASRAAAAPTPASPAAASAPPLEDDALCIVCLDAPRDTSLPGCAGRHAPVLCAPCAAAVASFGAAPACPWCGAAIAAAK